jgi:uncharacterized protein YggE
MPKKWFFAVILVVLLVFLAPFCTGCGSPAQGAETRVSVGQQPDGFWVSGTGEVTVTPNLATVWLGIQSQETSVSEAQSKTAANMKSVLQSLADSGVNQKDIQTGSFSINQRTRWDDPQQKDRIIGYTVTNMFTVKVRDVNKAGDIIDAAIKVL